MALKDQYLNALSRDKRVLNITHFDMDGAASSIILGNVYQNIKYKYLRYDEVDSYLEKLNFSEYDIVIMTDISPTKAELIEDKNVFLLDHHDSALFLNCPEKNRIVRNGKSAALLVKEFFEHLFGIDLSELNEFCKVLIYANSKIKELINFGKPQFKQSVSFEDFAKEVEKENNHKSNLNSLETLNKNCF